RSAIGGVQKRPADATRCRVEGGSATYAGIDLEATGGDPIILRTCKRSLFVATSIEFDSHSHLLLLLQSLLCLVRKTNLGAASMDGNLKFIAAFALSIGLWAGQTQAATYIYVSNAE